MAACSSCDEVVVTPVVWAATRGDCHDLEFDINPECFPPDAGGTPCPWHFGDEIPLTPGVFSILGEMGDGTGFNLEDFGDFIEVCSYGLDKSQADCEREYVAERGFLNELICIAKKYLVCLRYSKLVAKENVISLTEGEREELEQLKMIRGGIYDCSATFKFRELALMFAVHKQYSCQATVDACVLMEKFGLEKSEHGMTIRMKEGEVCTFDMYKRMVCERDVCSVFSFLLDRELSLRLLYFHTKIRQEPDPSAFFRFFKEEMDKIKHEEGTSLGMLYQRYLTLSAGDESFVKHSVIAGDGSVLLAGMEKMWRAIIGKARQEREVF